MSSQQMRRWDDLTPTFLLTASAVSQTQGKLNSRFHFEIKIKSSQTCFPKRQKRLRIPNCCEELRNLLRACNFPDHLLPNIIKLNLASVLITSCFSLHDIIIFSKFYFAIFMFQEEEERQFRVACRV